LETLEKRVFVPLVAWAPLPSPADARLLLSFGADRVVVDAWAGLPDPLAHIARVVQAVGKDRVGVAVSVRRVVGHKGVAWELVDGNLQGTGLDALQLARRLPEVGAAEVVLSPTLAGPGSERVVHDGELIESVLGWSGVPVLSHGDDADAADMAAALLMGADGVVSALPSSGRPTGLELKEKLAAYGLAFIPPER
jgi:imidazole glycerol phosphate synthase subunit HisF